MRAESVPESWEKSGLSVDSTPAARIIARSLPQGLGSRPPLDGVRGAPAHPGQRGSIGRAPDL